MTDYVTLLGAEDVRHAGSTIQSAAAQIQSAANQISDSVSILQQALITFIDDLHGTLQDNNIHKLGE